MAWVTFTEQQTGGKRRFRTETIQSIGQSPSPDHSWIYAAGIGSCLVIATLDEIQAKIDAAEAEDRDYPLHVVKAPGAKCFKPQPDHPPIPPKSEFFQRTGTTDYVRFGQYHEGALGDWWIIQPEMSEGIKKEIALLAYAEWMREAERWPQNHEYWEGRRTARAWLKWGGIE